MIDDDETEPAGVSWAWDTCEERDGSATVLVRAASSDKEAGTTLFVASTDTPDRAMDVVRQDWRLREFRSNPVILDNHDARRVVGTGIESTVPKTGDDAGRLVIRVRWDLENPDPSIRSVGHQHLQGIRRAGSVGFRSAKKTERHRLPLDHAAYQPAQTVDTWFGPMQMSGWYYEGNTLLEFSSATIPMNPEALQRSYVARSAPTVQDPTPAVARVTLLDLLRVAPPEERRDLARWLVSELRDYREFGDLVRGLVEAAPSPAAASGPTFYATLYSRLMEQM